MCVHIKHTITYGNRDAFGSNIWAWTLEGRQKTTFRLHFHRCMRIGGVFHCARHIVPQRNDSFFFSFVTETEISFFFSGSYVEVELEPFSSVLLGKMMDQMTSLNLFFSLTCCHFAVCYIFISSLFTIYRV